MRVRQVLALTAAAVLAAAGALVVLALPATATTFSVINSNDSGAGSLRAAFVAASADVTGAHTIDVQAGLSPITLSTGELLYSNASNEPLTIHGNGVTVNQTTAGGARVIHTASTGLLTVDRLTITGGNTSGGTFNGGGIFAVGAVTVTNSTISGNTSGGSLGGGILAFGAVTVTNSTISGNISGGGIVALGAVTVTNSTISGNTSGSSLGGGGIVALGAVTVTNSTISGNTAGSSGGGGIVAVGAVRLVYATVVANTAPTASNVRLLGTGIANLASFGSVVALPLGGGANCSLNATTTTSNGFNFSDDASCGFSAGTDHQNAGDPKLGPLANNGGSTLTRLPLVGSPLIDAIPLGHCSDDGASTISPLVDQSGLPRPQGAGCEIGAKEVAATTPTTTAPTAPTVLITPKFTG